MYHGSRIVVPLMENCLRHGGSQPARDFWRASAFPLTVRDVFNEVERQMENIERNFFRSTPLGIMSPRSIPVEGTECKQDSTYRLNIDVQDFKPEDIKISLKDGVLKIHANMDRTSEDGGRFMQSIVREYKLPQNIDVNSVKSLLHDNGVLSIEASTNQLNEPKNIPIEHVEGDKAKKSLA